LVLQSFYLDLVYEETGEEISDTPYPLRITPDAIHKANQSGSGPIQIMFPNPAIDAPLISDDWDRTLLCAVGSVWYNYSPTNITAQADD
jgi:hypothetical protein